MDDSERVEKLQELLMEAFAEYQSKIRRPVTQTQFAHYLGVSPVSLSQWMNGTRLPGFDNTVRLAKRLGERIFDITGYSRTEVVTDPILRYIVSHWHLLDEETQNTIYGHVREESEEKIGRGG